MSDDPEPTDLVWKRIDEELTTRRDRHQRPASWAEVARALGTTEQRLNNWKRRRVPPSAYGELADLLGWSVDQVAGRDGRPKVAAATSDSADEILTLLTYFKQLDIARRARVISFALDQRNAMLKPRVTGEAPKLKPARRLPRADQGAISTTPLSKSSAASKRKALK